MKIYSLFTRCGKLSLQRLYVKRSPWISRSNTLYQNFSSQEPSYMVDSDERVDAHLVKVPFLSEDAKLDMYQKHVAEPEVWTIQKLSQHFGSSLQRTSAVIYLMRKRQEAMVRAGITGSDDQNVSAELKVYEKYCEDKTKSLENLAEELGGDSKYNTVQLKQIVEKWDTHRKRMENVNQHEAYMKGVMESLAGDGIDTSFQETPTDAKRSLQDSYYPELFGDEALKEEKEKLLRRVSSETKAKINDDVMYMMSKFANQSGLPAAPAYISASCLSAFDKAETTAKPNRWKFAFRDLSHMNYKKPQLKAVVTQVDGDGGVVRDIEGGEQVSTSSSAVGSNEFMRAKPPYLPANTVVTSRGGRYGVFKNRFVTPNILPASYDVFEQLVLDML